MAIAMVMGRLPELLDGCFTFGGKPGEKLQEILITATLDIENAIQRTCGTSPSLALSLR